MRSLLIAASLLTLAACSKAPDGDAGPDLNGNATAGVAFTYAYDFELPSRSISDLQEAHAQACERLGAGRCRITGLRYNVDRDGGVAASLSVKVAAPIARAFGRGAVKTAESTGAILVGSEIGGEDVATATGESIARQRTAEADAQRIAGQLARSDLPPAERAELLRQQATQIDEARTQAREAGRQQQRLANTPMSFDYRAGHGRGLLNGLRDTADTALASTRTTLTALVWVVAALGPPALVILLVLLLWIRWGRSLWRRAIGTAAD